MSTPRNGNGATKVPVSGTEMALLLSSTLLLDVWSFERPAARVMLMRNHKNARAIHDQMSHESRRILEAAGAYTSPVRPWTREFIAKRAGVEGEIGLMPEQLQLCAWALRVCHNEFATNWGEFCVVAPGNIDWYGATPEDLLILADKLESLLPEVSE
jgi:hypothetical protein